MLAVSGKCSYTYFILLKVLCEALMDFLHKL